MKREFPVSLADAIGNATRPTTLAEIHARIIGPELVAQTAAIRSAPDREARNLLKRRLPGFLAAGLFAKRNRTAWETASGLVICDFDHVTDLVGLLASLRSDPCVALVFKSPSGDGAKCALCVPCTAPCEEQHARAFAAAQRWALECHGAQLDPSGRDPARLAYFVYDPSAFLNLDAEPLDLSRWAPDAQTSAIDCALPEPVREVPRPMPAGDLLKRAAAYLDRLPPSVSGQDGHGSLLRAAVCVAWGFDLQDDNALPLLERYNGRAAPAWSTVDLQRKLDEARRIPHREPRGWLRDAAGSAPDLKTAAPAASEAGIAQALAESGDLAKRLRWSARDSGAWLVWEGTHWQRTEDRLPLALQAQVRRAVAGLLDSRACDVATARRLESAGALRGIASLLSAWPEMRMPEEVDPPGLLVTPRGVIDLVTGEILPHDPARPVTRCTPVDPGPTCPLWDLIENHLRACLDDLTFVALHRHLGGALYGTPADRRLAWLTGPGRDSKSKLTAAIRCALGAYVGILPAEVLSADSRGGAHHHELAAAALGTRLAIGQEIPAALNWPAAKSWTGGDAITSKRTHGRHFTIDRFPFLLLVSNSDPIAPDSASADRILLARLRTVSDPSDKLHQTLAQPGPERDAIAAAGLSWLLRGCAEMVEHGPGPAPRYGGDLAPCLVDWWQGGIAGGWLRPNGGKSSLGDLRASAAAWGAGRGLELDLAGLASFLRARVGTKHTEHGNRYLVGIQNLKAAEPQIHTPPVCMERSVSRVQPPSASATSPTGRRSIVL